jgi:phosphoglucosamine mutase
MLHDQPDGRNINENCGSTNVASLISAVQYTGANLGLAFDGDADRLIAVDEAGHVRDGDDLMVLFTLDLALRDLLGGGLVVTSMSNLGLHQALVSHGIAIVETEVGDRNVLMALEEQSWLFGGEQSGHLIFRDIAPTGDGLLTGLLLCDLVVRRGPLSDQAVAAWQRVPQAIINVARDSYDDVAVRQIFDELSGFYRVEADDVRLVIRPSGTEPVIRVMIEGLNGDFVKEFTRRLQGFFHA